MASSNPQRFNDEEGTLRLAIAGVLAGVWTALPAEVVSYDADSQTVTVQPLVQGIVTAPDGTSAAINLPLINDVPVQFPSGGGVTLTFPVAPGDECMLVFSSRGFDAWHQLGDVQPPVPGRSHALSDAVALLGIRSIPHVLSPPPSTEAAQLRSDDGTIYVEVNRLGAATVKASLIKLDGDVITTGNVAVGTGASGMFTTPTGQTVTVQDGIITNIF